MDKLSFKIRVVYPLPLFISPLQNKVSQKSAKLISKVIVVSFTHSDFIV